MECANAWAFIPFSVFLISHSGLPYRELINHSFLMLAMGSGLDLPIINPNVESMMNAVMAFNVLNNVDKDSMAYIEKFADYTPPTAGAARGTNASGGSCGARGAGRTCCRKHRACHR